MPIEHLTVARRRAPRTVADELRRDVVYALRQLARTPAFSAIAVLTLALGIGATTAIFSAVWSVVLRPFPFAHPERVVRVAEHWQGSDGDVSDGNFVDWQARAKPSTTSITTACSACSSRVRQRRTRRSS
jgi:hypothetical protein